MVWLGRVRAVVIGGSVARWKLWIIEFSSPPPRLADNAHAGSVARVTTPPSASRPHVPTYIVTDIELDGPRPGTNSLRSFASVAVTPDAPRGVAADRDCFEAVLEPLPGATPSPDTLAWFEQQNPEVWAAATRDPRPATVVMADWVSWVRSHAGPIVFVASPVAFDGGWIDHYLRSFTQYGLVQGPYEQDRLFDSAFCLHSFAAGVTGALPGAFTVHDLPTAWFGEVPHTHRAVDDALGYANLLLSLLDRTAG